MGQVALVQKPEDFLEFSLPDIPLRRQTAFFLLLIMDYIVTEKLKGKSLCQTDVSKGTVSII